jgi:hypothetical protein
MRTSPVITVAAGGSGAPPLRPGTPPQAETTILASLQMRLNVALRWIGPPSGGGGPRGPGGPSRPRLPGGAPVQVPQQPVAPTGDIKTMGQLPQIFTGVTCAPSSAFSIIIPRGLSSALICHIRYKGLFVLQMDMIVLLLRYNSPYGYLGLIGYLGLKHNGVVLAQGAPI